MTFIVRLTGRGESGPTGVVERVKTGEKHRFLGTDAIGPLLTRLINDELRGTAQDLPNHAASEIRRGADDVV